MSFDILYKNMALLLNDIFGDFTGYLFIISVLQSYKTHVIDLQFIISQNSALNLFTKLMINYTSAVGPADLIKSRLLSLIKIRSQFC